MGMKRRTLLTAGGAAAALIALPSAARATVRGPLFEWAQPGGFFAPGAGVLVAPPLAAYDDRTAYADAAASLRLSAGRVEALRELAIRVLRYRIPGGAVPGDRPVDFVRVRTEAGDYRTARLDGWGDGDPDRRFPAVLHELWDEVQRLRGRVARAGEPWRPAAVLIAAVRLDHTPADVRPWPRGVRVPAVHGRYGELRLRGDDALAVRRTVVPRTATGGWPAYRIGAGTHLAVTWRNLLPHE